MFIAIISMTLCKSLWGLRGFSLLACVLNIAIGFRLTASTWHGDILTLHLGNWPAPYGIVLVADLMASMLLLLGAILSLLIVLFSQRGLKDRRERRFFHPLVQFLMMGVNMAFLSGDMFNLFVSYEVMLLSSYGLMCLGSGRRELKPLYMYLILNIVSGTLFLFACGITYGFMGTLNLADMAMKVRELEPDQMKKLLVVVMMFIIVFGSKAAMFPLFFWLPHSYGAAATPIVALFAGLLTKVGVYSMIRVLVGVFGPVFEGLQPFVLTLAGLTMVLGVLGAVSQNTIKKILSFHIVSQVGYMIMGLTLLAPATVAGALYFMMHNMVVKTGLLLLGGMVEMKRGTDELSKLGGLWRSDRTLGIAFFLLAMSLAGIPPLTGFWGKLMLIQAGFEVEAYAIVGVSIFTSILTLFSMLKIWLYAFWRDTPDDPEGAKQAFANAQLPQPHSRQWVGVGVLGALTLWMGIIAEPMVAASLRAADTALDVERQHFVVIENSGGWSSRLLIDPVYHLRQGAPVLPSLEKPQDHEQHGEHLVPDPTETSKAGAPPIVDIPALPNNASAPTNSTASTDKEVRT
jgi:multicomponent Na+:H+ antiporter subunit D